MSSTNRNSLVPSRIRRRSRIVVKPRAFTLLELLVVVAIISLLIAVLLPTLSRARQVSNRSVCLSNLRQLAATWKMYLDDSQGRFLKGVNTNINYGGIQGGGAAAWGSDPALPIAKPLNTYLKVEPVASSGCDVFHCPADDGSPTVRPTHFQFYGTSYEMNTMMVGPTSLQFPPFDPCAPVYYKVNARLPNQAVSSDMSAPSKLILMGDFGWISALTFWDTQRIEWHDRPCSHNLAFMDGHVSFTQLKKGLSTTNEYTRIPFQDLQSEVVACQQEVACP